jgi:hypothetical protein
MSREDFIAQSQDRNALGQEAQEIALTSERLRAPITGSWFIAAFR